MPSFSAKQYNKTAATIRPAPTATVPSAEDLGIATAAPVAPSIPSTPIAAATATPSAEDLGISTPSASSASPAPSQHPPTPPSAEDLGISTAKPTEHFEDMSLADVSEGGGLVTGQPVRDWELQDIASRHPSISAENLKHVVSAYTGVLDNPSSHINGTPTLMDTMREFGLRAGGMFTRDLAAGGVQAVHRWLQTPDTREALEELNDLVLKKRSYLQAGAELASNIAIGGAGFMMTKAAAGLTPALATLPFTSALTATYDTHLDNAGQAAVVGFGLGLIPGAITAVSATRKLFALPEIQHVVANQVDAIAKSPQFQAELAEARALLTSKTPDTATQALENPDIQNLIRAQNTRTQFNPRADKLIQVDTGNIKTIADLQREIPNPETLSTALETVKLNQAAMQALANTPQINKAGDWGRINRAMAQLADNRPAFEDIDRRLGGATDTTGTIRTLSQKSIVFSIDEAAWKGKVLKSLPYSSDAEIAHTDKLMESLKAGEPVDKSISSEEMGKITEDLIKPLSEEYTERTGIKLEPDQLLNIQSRLPLREYAGAVAERVDSINRKYGIDMLAMDTGTLAKIRGDREVSELLREAVYASGTKIKSEKDFGNKLFGMLNGEYGVSAKLNQPADAAMSEIVPDFVRDDNPLRTVYRWVNSMHQMNLRPEMNKLGQYAQIADQAGMSNISQTILTIRDSFNGLNAQSAISNWAKRRELAISQWAAREPGYSVAQLINNSLPNMLAATEMIYPATVGWSPKAILQHIMQPYISILPELGGMYGTKIGLETTFDLARFAQHGEQLTRLNSPALAVKYGKKLGDQIMLKGSEFLANEGLLEQKFTGEMTSSLEQGLRGAGIVGKYFNAVRDFGMLGMSKAMVEGRLIAVNMARRIAEDLSEKSKLALNFVDQIRDVGTRQRLLNLVASGDKMGLEKEMMSYLNAEHLLLYDKYHTFQIGRQLGPMFRLFTKIPTTALGRVWFEAQSKSGFANLTRKFFAPAAALGIANELLFDEDTQKSEAFQILLGKGGLSDWTFAQHLKPENLPIIGEHGLANVPVMRLAKDIGRIPYDIVTNTEDDNSDKLLKSIDNATYNLLNNFIFPVSGSLLSETLPRAVQNEPVKNIYSSDEYKTLRLIKRPLYMLDQSLHGFTQDY